MPKAHTSLFSSRTFLALGVGFVSALLISSTGSPINAAGGSGNADDEVDIGKLTVCYAKGTDAIGGGDLQAGKNIYRNCFTNDAEIAVYFPGADYNGPPDFVTTGTDSWADFVESVFNGYGYTATQHLMGNVVVNVTGHHATMSSDLSATHALGNGTIDVAHGTYQDEVVRRQGKWLIRRRTLKLFTFVHVGGP